MPESNLLRELRWYQEQFLDYPFHPEIDHAERVLKTLRSWGAEVFLALFGSTQGRDWYRDATRNGYNQLTLQISSDDPSTLCWPWEALRDPETDTLGLGCHIQRKLTKVTDPLPLSDALPQNQVNILLVTARPFERDVAYRSISRPLVELIEAQHLPARVTLLRPPTFDQLLTHLREHPDIYHILHFDGHGGYGNASGTGDPHTFRGPLGHLVFEKADGTPDLITADLLGTLLREHRIPAVVLNACQSAMIDQGAENAFASVASSLIRAGIRSVVAMSYSLYVSGAQQFLPAFYRRLFESGSMQEAVRAGRQQMFREQGRACARGTYPLQDWLVPVIYAQEELDFRFVAQAKPVQPKNKTFDLPEEASDDQNPYGFIGRDSTLLALERAVRRSPAGILVHGLGGVGKTTLARGFIHWRRKTDGPEKGVFWFSFNEINNAESVINCMGEVLVGGSFNPLPYAKKEDLLVRIFRDQPYLIVWDNFESVRGIAGTEVPAQLSAADQQLLLRFLERLRDGPTKVLITSRSEEQWLGSTNRFKVSMGGLQAEERWEFCRVILRDLGKKIDRSDPELVELMNALDGHPLMMRVVLPLLEKQSAASLLAALLENQEALGMGGDEAGKRLQATLRFATQCLPVELRSLLVPISMHEHYVVYNHLETMVKHMGGEWGQKQVCSLLSMLADAGLVRKIAFAVFELHPAFTGYLREAELSPEYTHEEWAQSFVNVMASLAAQIAPLPLHKQRSDFHFLHANFYQALQKAEILQMNVDLALLIQGLASFALNIWRLGEAEVLFRRLAEHAKHCGNEDWEVSAYEHLGRIALARRQLDEAGDWYKRSLAIEEKHGIDYGAGSTYHELGILAMEQRDFEAAEGWFKKSHAIDEKEGNHYGIALSYLELGTLALVQRQLDAAEIFYKKCLPIFGRYGAQHKVAITNFQSGLVAHQRRDLLTAENRYKKGLAIWEKLDDKHHTAGAYHQLGIVAEDRRDYDVAEKWYKKSLTIREKHGDKIGAASTYHQLGIIAMERRNFAAAEAWYKKSLLFKEGQDNEYGAATTYHQLGKLAQEQGDFNAAETWYKKSLAISEKYGNEHNATITLALLGLVVALKKEYTAGARALIKAIQGFIRQNEEYHTRIFSQNFLTLLSLAPETEREQIRAMWTEAGLDEL